MMATMMRMIKIKATTQSMQLPPEQISPKSHYIIITTKMSKAKQKPTTLINQHFSSPHSQLGNFLNSKNSKQNKTETMSDNFTDQPTSRCQRDIFSTSA